MRCFLIALLGILLTGCSYFHGYRPDFQQGNVINPQQLSQLRIGMGKLDVEQLMGEPILQNALYENRWLYVYTFKTNNGPLIIKQVALTFQNGRLTKIEKNLDYHPSEAS